MIYFFCEISPFEFNCMLRKIILCTLKQLILFEICLNSVTVSCMFKKSNLKPWIY